MAGKYNDLAEEINKVKIEGQPDTFEMEKIKTTYYNKSDAPLEETNFKVLVELSGLEAGANRPGIDLVAVLDISSSMRHGDRLKHAKVATTFLVKKLSPIDRLSIVTFSDHAKTWCHLTSMTPDAKSGMERLVEGIPLESGTNITAGLREAVAVLDNRGPPASGRVGAIMFMSDGDPYPRQANGSDVPLNNYPVHTICLGKDCKRPQVLKDIAERSMGGTFSIADVGNEDMSSLSLAFSQILAGLLTIVVQDLSLTMTAQNSKFVKVSAGNYRLRENEAEGSVTISFGNLYGKEIRSILVDLLLDAVDEPKGVDTLEFSYNYKIGDKEIDSNLVIIAVTRVKAPTSQENPEILVEGARQETVNAIGGARKIIDENEENLPAAKSMVEDAKTNLNRDELDKSHPTIKGLQEELEQLLKFMESSEIFKQFGRAFALATELSHALQRYAAKGNVNNNRLFATPAMNQLLDQVKNFEKNPSEVDLPTLEEDLKEREIIEEEKEKEKEKEKEEKSEKDTDDQKKIAALLDALSNHLQDAINSLKAVRELLKAASH